MLNPLARAKLQRPGAIQVGGDLDRVEVVGCHGVERPALDRAGLANVADRTQHGLAQHGVERRPVLRRQGARDRPKRQRRTAGALHHHRRRLHQPGAQRPGADAQADEEQVDRQRSQQRDDQIAPVQDASPPSSNRPAL
jgi:hypothetical protein